MRPARLPIGVSRCSPGSVMEAVAILEIAKQRLKAQNKRRDMERGGGLSDCCGQNPAGRKLIDLSERDGAGGEPLHLARDEGLDLPESAEMTEFLAADVDVKHVLGEKHDFHHGEGIEAKVIGVLKFLDGGEQDDKLVAVMPDSPLGSVNNLDELKQHFQGALEILETWFSNYKGPGEMVSKGSGDVAEANSILDAASTMFEAPSFFFWR